MYYKVLSMRPLGTMNVFTRFHVNSSNSWDISVQTNVVDWLTVPCSHDASATTTQTCTLSLCRSVCQYSALNSAHNDLMTDQHEVQQLCSYFRIWLEQEGSRERERESDGAAACVSLCFCVKGECDSTGRLAVSRWTSVMSHGVWVVVMATEENWTF